MVNPPDKSAGFFILKILIWQKSEGISELLLDFIINVWRIFAKYWRDFYKNVGGLFYK